jgi:hypothetical protein
MLTYEELAAMRARVEAATPGPWRSTWDEIKSPPERYDDDEVAVESAATALSGDGNELKRMVVGTTYYDGVNLAIRRPDAAFIAAARTDIPRLLDEVERLRALVTQLDSAVFTLSERVANQLCDAGEVERLRTRVAELESRVLVTVDKDGTDTLGTLSPATAKQLEAAVEQARAEERERAARAARMTVLDILQHDGEIADAVANAVRWEPGHE